ncbi:hypothetical protein BC940DRAFT_299839 [Gongronella butleri]|nr:hypothetical protein BC940DRAFT_299839 [Gongronella butleri]
MHLKTLFHPRVKALILQMWIQSVCLRATLRVQDICRVVRRGLVRMMMMRVVRCTGARGRRVKRSQKVNFIDSRLRRLRRRRRLLCLLLLCRLLCARRHGHPRGWCCCGRTRCGRGHTGQLA